MRSSYDQIQDRPRLAVFKFASCDGCQLQLLSCEDELLLLGERIEIAYFLEASSQLQPGPYDITLVEGSITTPHDITRIREIREQSKVLVTIGACATAGGIQALRNWADHDEYMRMVYADPSYIKTLATSTAIADHVRVDFELRGCPIDKRQLLDLIGSLIAGRTPRVPRHSVCLDCKREHAICVAVARGIPCIGPITQSGCGALCPSHLRGCYGCFGPNSQANAESLCDWYLRKEQHTPESLLPVLRNFNAGAEAFRRCSDMLAQVSEPPRSSDSRGER